MVSNKADLNKTRYTHRDYDSIKSDLINAIPSLTQEWTSREDADPGIVLIKLMAMFGDTLSYNIDKIALELYLSSVTQRKNCAKILRLLGYKMHWYRAARVIAHVRLSESKDSSGNLRRVLMYPFRTKFYAGSLLYSVANQGVGSGEIDIYSTTQTVPIKLVQGRKGQDTFRKEDLVSDNRYYLAVSNVDESEFLLEVSGGKNVSCELVDNLYLTAGTSKIYYEFNVDEYDRPYIQLIENWEDIVGSETAEFTLTYIITNGSVGNITSNAFTLVDELKSGSYKNLVITNLPNTTKYGSDFKSLDSYNCPGYDPQTVDEAKIDSANYVFTHDSLVTSSDYEKAAKRVYGITVSKYVDSQVILKDNLSLDGIVKRGLDNQEVGSKSGKTEVEYNDGLIKKVTEESDTNPDEFVDKEYLVPYASLLYVAYRNFDAYYNYYYQSLNSDENTYGHEWSLRSRYAVDDNGELVKDKSGNYEIENTQIEDVYDIVTAKLKEVGYYPYRPLENICQSVRDEIKSLHTLNVSVDFGTLKLFPFKVKGTLHLTEPLPPQETLQVVEVVDDALDEAYYPDLHNIGEKPNFIEIVDTIQNSDVRIKYFDAIDQIVEWAPAICLDKSSDQYIDKIFDTTSAVMYNGLSREFTLDKKFLSFKLRNIGAVVDSSDQVIGGSEPDSAVPEDYDTAYLKNYSDSAGLPTIKTVSRSQTVQIDVDNLRQLRALCKDLTYKGYINTRGNVEVNTEVTYEMESSVDSYSTINFSGLSGYIINEIVVTGPSPFSLKSLVQDGNQYIFNNLSPDDKEGTTFRISQDTEFSYNGAVVKGSEVFSKFFLNPEKNVYLDTMIDSSELASRPNEYVATITYSPAKFVEDSDGNYYQTKLINNSGLQWVR